VTRGKKKQVAVQVSAPAPAAELVIEQGYGLRAWLDAPYLFIAQTDGETHVTETVCLSRSELRQLLAQFKDFVA
jgi:hypothetical protein